MPLAHLEKRSSEDFVPYLKFNGKAGRWYNKTEDGSEAEITNLNAIFDLAQIKTGWFLYMEGAAPDRVFHNGSAVSRPSAEHKQGFLVHVYSMQQLGGVREFSSTSNIVIEAIRDLYDNQFEPAPEAADGLVPVVKCEAVVPVKGKFGTNYQPMFKIVKWVARPNALKLETATPRRAAAVDPEVPPPVMRPTQAATGDGDSEEF